MKFLVIGGSGFIGRHILRAARRAGFKAEGTSVRGVSGFWKYDLTGPSLRDSVPARILESKGGLTVVIASFVTDMDRCLTEPKLTRHINVVCTCRLADEVAALGGKIVFLSTGHVFDGKRGRYREDETTAPVNRYAEQKMEVEQYLCRRIPGAFIARLDKVVGTDARETHLLSEWLTRASSGQMIACVEGMEISPTAVTDVADGLIKASQFGLSGIYNLAGPDAVDRAEYARRFCRMAGFPIRVETRPLDSFPFRDGRALRSSLCAERFTHTSGMTFMGSDEILLRFFGSLGSEPGVGATMG